MPKLLEHHGPFEKDYFPPVELAKRMTSEIPPAPPAPAAPGQSNYTMEEIVFEYDSPITFALRKGREVLSTDEAPMYFLFVGMSAKPPKKFGKVKTQWLSEHPKDKVNYLNYAGLCDIALKPSDIPDELWMLTPPSVVVGCDMLQDRTDKPLIRTLIKTLDQRRFIGAVDNMFKFGLMGMYNISTQPAEVKDFPWSKKPYIRQIRFNKQ